jgi:hypothetical protein
MQAGARISRFETGPGRWLASVCVIWPAQAQLSRERTRRLRTVSGDRSDYRPDLDHIPGQPSMVSPPWLVSP